MRKIAITGGLSSGKSSVCKLLKELGAYVVSADDIVHKLLSPHSPIGNKILELLGDEIMNQNQFDRTKIANKVFKNKETLNALERIIHPAVLEAVEKEYQQIKNEPKYPLFVAEIPLLYEIESEHLFDKVVTVHADPHLARMRFQEKTSHSAEEFEKRMSHQLPPDHKIAKADYVILNNGDISHLKIEVEKLYEYLTN